jgi:hypothetical protein
MIRSLRSPGVIVGELAAFAVAGAIGAARPELRVFHSPWFAALAVVAAVSLVIVVHDQVRALLQSGATPRRTGSLVLHAGVLLVVLGGACRAWFASEAFADVFEGETLPPTAAAWSGQSSGLFARPFHFDRPIRLEAVHGARYPDGSVRELKALLSVGELAVNRDLVLPGGRLFLASDFSTAALIEWRGAGRVAALLDSHTCEGAFAGPDGLRAHFRAFTERPEKIEVRVMRGNGLLYAGLMRVGQTIALAGGETLTLHGLPLWVRMRGSRDHSVWLVYLGFALVLAGSVVLFTGMPPALRAVADVPVAPNLAPVRAPAPRRSDAAAEGNGTGCDSVFCSCGTLSPCAATGVPDRILRRRTPGQVWAALSLLCAALAICSCRPSHEEARQLVERYNTIVAEAYRRGDARLTDPVVSPNEGKKLTGLIGVRLDMGLTLDSEMLSLDVVGVEQKGDELRVRTQEQWRYRERRIGTGEPVGEASFDSYAMLYRFKRGKGAWLVDEIRFAAPPRVGRTSEVWAAAHGTENRP